MFSACAAWCLSRWHNKNIFMIDIDTCHVVMMRNYLVMTKKFEVAKFRGNFLLKGLLNFFGHHIKCYREHFANICCLKVQRRQC